MIIVFDIIHPADVHLFKNAIKQFIADGNNVIVMARDKDVALDILYAEKIFYKNISKQRIGLLWGFFELIKRTLFLFFIVIRHRPNILVAATGVSVGIVGFITRVPNIQFYDTEKAKLQNMISYPFATKIFTPRAYQHTISSRHEKYDGYHELAYLHPDYFQPDPSVLDVLGINQGERFCVIRFVSFGAAHDVGAIGFSRSNKIKLVQELSQYGKVFIIAEEEVPEELQQYVLPTRSEDFHSVIYFSSLVVGEGATIASEAAVLGVPAVFIYSFGLGYTDEQEHRYGLVSNFLSDEKSQQQAIERSVSLFMDSDTRSSLRSNHEKLLDDTIDVTKFIVEKTYEYTKN